MKNLLEEKTKIHGISIRIRKNVAREEKNQETRITKVPMKHISIEISSSMKLFSREKEL